MRLQELLISWWWDSSAGRGAPGEDRDRMGELMGAPAAEKHWGGRGEPWCQEWLCPVWPRTGGEFPSPRCLQAVTLWDLVAPPWQASLMGLHGLYSVSSPDPVLFCVLLGIHSWWACLGHLQIGHLAMLLSLFSPTNREGCSSSNLSLEIQSGPLFSLPLLQGWVSGPSVPTPPGEEHNLIPHSVWKLGLQTTLSCALEITNW